MSITGRIILLMFIVCGLIINILSLCGYPNDGGWVFSSWGGVIIWSIGLIIESIELIYEVSDD